jgi:transposase-like protein
VEADQATVWRWVRYGPEREQRLRGHLKPTNKSWRVDETCLYRSITILAVLLVPPLQRNAILYPGS